MVTKRYPMKLFVVMVIVIIIKILPLEAKKFENLMKSRVNAIAGLFPTSKDVIMNEILRRTSQDDCLKDLRLFFSEDYSKFKNLSSSEHVISIGFVEYTFYDSFDYPFSRNLTEVLAVRENYLWMFAPFIKSHGDTSLLGFAYACFTDSGKQVFLPFFGNNIYRVESMELNEGMLTLRNGSDQMVIRMTYDPDCDPAPDTTDQDLHNIRQSAMFSLSGPFNWQVCDILDPDVELCKVAKENSCKISGAKQDFCFLLDNVGPSRRCNAEMEITDVTGVFREKSMLLSTTSVKAIESEWIRGNRSLAMSTPCF